MSEAAERWGVWCEPGDEVRKAQWLSDYAGFDAASKPAEFSTRAEAEECAVRSWLRNATWKYEARLLLVPADRLAKALDLARRYSQIDGSHHKAWTLDQMVRALTGDDYDRWVEESKEGDTYGWDVGIAP